MHIKGWGLSLVCRFVSSGALKESHLTVPWDPAVLQMYGDMSLVRILGHH